MVTGKPDARRAAGCSGGGHLVVSGCSRAVNAHVSCLTRLLLFQSFCGAFFSPESLGVSWVLTFPAPSLVHMRPNQSLGAHGHVFPRLEASRQTAFRSPPLRPPDIVSGLWSRACAVRSGRRGRSAPAPPRLGPHGVL